MAVDELTEFKRTFFQECDELLGDLEGHLTALKDGRVEDEVLHAAFRAIHSIKGGAGAFGFSELVTFAHVFENVLDLLRSHKLELDNAKAALLIRAADVLADLVAAARTGTAPAAGFGEDVLRELHALAGTEAGAANGGELDDVFASARAATAAPVPAAPPAEPARRTLTIRFAPGAEMFRRANDPLLLIRELKTLGTLTTRSDASRLPPLEEMEPDEAYLEWQIELKTSEPREAVEEVFEFVVGDCLLTVADPMAGTAAAPEQPAPEAGGAPAAAAGAAATRAADGGGEPAASGAVARADPTQAPGAAAPGARSRPYPIRRRRRSGSTSTRSTAWSTWSASWSSPRRS